MSIKIIKSRRKIIYNQREIHLPFGIMHFIKKDELNIIEKNTELYLADEANDINFKIYPPYQSGKIFIVTRDKDRLECQNLILNEHYLQPPNKGMFIAYKEKDKIIGCCVIDELIHGNPTGRKEISPELKKEWSKQIWSSLKRDEVRNKLNILWLSRIVVDKSYWNRKIGTKLLESAIHILKEYHPKKPKFLEIIATYEKDAFSTTKNIFCKAGYNYTYLNKWTHNILDSDSGNFKPIPAERYYFWKKIDEKVDRLFVPLNKEPFEWFQDGKKLWELRRCENQFSRKFIYKNRLVELRQGYNSDKIIWGNITEVIEKKSIEDIFDLINFKEIIPIAKDKQEAIQYVKTILKPKESVNFIALKIEKRI